MRLIMFHSSIAKETSIDNQKIYIHIRYEKTLFLIFLRLLLIKYFSILFEIFHNTAPHLKQHIFGLGTDALEWRTWIVHWHPSELQTRAARTRFPFLAFHRHSIELLFLPYQCWQIMSRSPNIDLTRVNADACTSFAPPGRTKHVDDAKWMYDSRKINLQKFPTKFFPASTCSVEINES